MQFSHGEIPHVHSPKTDARPSRPSRPSARRRCLWRSAASSSGRVGWSRRRLRPFCPSRSRRRGFPSRSRWRRAVEVDAMAVRRLGGRRADGVVRRHLLHAVSRAAQRGRANGGGGRHRLGAARRRRRKRLWLDGRQAVRSPRGVSNRAGRGANRVGVAIAIERAGRLDAARRVRRRERRDNRAFGRRWASEKTRRLAIPLYPPAIAIV